MKQFILIGMLWVTANCSSTSEKHEPHHSDAASDGASDAPLDDAAVDGDSDSGSNPETISLVYTAELNGTITVYKGHAPNSLELLGSVTQAGSMRFLAFSPTGNHLYAVNENRVEAFSLTSSETPVFLGSATMANQGTHLEVDHTGQWIVAVTFQGNAIQVFPIQTNAIPGSVTQTFGGAGSPNFCKRAHQIRIHRSNRWVYVPCRDSDHVVRFELNEDTGVLASLGSVATPAGTGPRHMDFHPSLNIAYVLGESSSHVIVYSLDTSTGALSQLQDVSTLPAGVTTGSTASDIHVSADGHYVFTVNRDPRNEIVSFEVQSDGKLTRLGAVSAQGTGARTFTLASNDEWLGVANTTSPNLTTFFVNSNTGALTYVQTYEPYTSNAFYVGVRPQ